MVTQRGLGPAAPLLLLRLLSLLPLGDGRDATNSSANGNGNMAAGAAATAAAASAGLQDGHSGNSNGNGAAAVRAAAPAAAAAASLDTSPDELRQGYLNFYRHLVTVLEDSAKREPSGLGPAAIVRCYECWAALGLGVSPPRSSLVGLKLRELLRGSKLGTQVGELERALGGNGAQSNEQEAAGVRELLRGSRLGTQVQGWAGHSKYTFTFSVVCTHARSGNRLGMKVGRKHS